jgi:hypothetical protein
MTRNQKQEKHMEDHDCAVEGGATGRHIRDVDDLGLQACERSVLKSFRHICLGYASHSARGWDAAFDESEKTFGCTDGPLVTARLAALIRAVRVERSEPFDFLSPHCQSCAKRLSASEWVLFSLVKAARLHDSQGLIRSAVELTKSSEPRLTIMAALALGAVLSGAAGARTTRGRHLREPELVIRKLN